MATAIAVAYLEKRWMASKPVWEMVVAKARTWMGTQVSPVSPHAVDELVEKAKGLL